MDKRLSAPRCSIKKSVWSVPATADDYFSAAGTLALKFRLPTNNAVSVMSVSWIVVRVEDQAVVGHYRSRREAAERAFQFSKRGPHVAIRQVGPGWPHRHEGVFESEISNL